jgi:hypothetical protein
MSSVSPSIGKVAPNRRVRSCARQTKHARRRRVKILRELRQTDCFRDDHIVGERPVTDVIAHQNAEDCVAFREIGHAFSHRFDGAGEVLAEHDRKAMLHHVLDHPEGNAHVEAVDGRVAHLYQHLARTRLRNRHFQDLGSLLEAF